MSDPSVRLPGAWLRYVFALAVTAVAAASSLAADPVESVTSPVQSPNDDYAYRLVTLDNGLQALLVSDPDTRKAAASLDVMVGSGDNPRGREGLAHFLEHMLFLGTEKYPDAAEYERYITEHGGSRNAYTSFEHTNYFFDIDAGHLDEALDRFAQFFISPNFDAVYVDREKNAVEAEYQMGLKSDGRRGLDVLQEVMNPRHPFSQFSVGSLETLADRPGSSIRDDLLAFYRKHYSANAMRLVVMGAEPLDELEAMVTKRFVQVPNHNYTPEPIAAPLFDPRELPMLVTVQPQAVSRQLQVNFTLPEYRSEYTSKPMSYLGNLIGHEGEGSVLALLKKEGLADGLGAGGGLDWRGGSLFSVSVSLTDKGVEEYERILQVLFAYFDLLREEGPRQWLFEEQAQLAQLSFRFREQGAPIGYVSSLSSGMHDYAPRDVLAGPYLMQDYRPDLISAALAALRPEQAQIVLTAPDVPTDRRSEKYDVPYSVKTLTEEDIAGWLADERPDELHLPDPNAFIAEDVALLPLADENPELPEVRHEAERQRIWYRQSEEFRVPRGALYINFRSPAVGESAAQTAAAVLYTNLLSDRVNTFTYPATLAGLNFSIYKHAQGISMRISGYNDKQLTLLKRLLGVIAEPAFTQDRFDNVRADLVRSLENAVAKRPSSQVLDDLREALQYGEYGETVLINELQALDLKGLTAYADAFWRDAKAEALLYGNYPASAVGELSDLLAGQLPEGEAPGLPPLRVLKLAADESIRFVTDVPHADAVVAWYLQGAGDAVEDRAATSLTAQTMRSGFFQQLRTEQQLGYVVSAFSWPQHDVPGLVMLVQAPGHSSAHVADAMQTFMEKLPEEVDEPAFLRHRQALVNDIMEPDKNLLERAEYYWQSIARNQVSFDRRQRLAEAVEGMSREAWLDYYREHFLESRRSLLVVAPGEQGDTPDGPARELNAADAIKTDHAVYTIE
ncbi:insulinase family protein [Chromatocurvus halotolerans]|uniref:Protease 3 n=1 Tax=Chromatocurvus halotolerans TaxID=1132028 RepID=A0A4R2KUU7_9GAMM|nr:insulinase family protein [Chromatocurvus halotolerans]TCO74919.1 secreted Zn-dependent insulinase-like peptidase [Chromatocurvus halotolerans]